MLLEVYTDSKFSKTKVYKTKEISVQLPPMFNDMIVNGAVPMVSFNTDDDVAMFIPVEFVISVREED